MPETQSPHSEEILERQEGLLEPLREGTIR